MLRPFFASQHDGLGIGKRANPNFPGEAHGDGLERLCLSAAFDVSRVLPASHRRQRRSSGSVERVRNISCLSRLIWEVHSARAPDQLSRRLLFRETREAGHRSSAMRCLTLALGLSIVSTIASSAGACGLTPPIGPNGLPAVCHGDDTVRLRAGLTVGGTATTIRFGDTTADLLQGAMTAAFDIFPLERLGLSLALGTTFGGHVDYLGSRYDLGPGIIGGVGASYRFLGNTGLPFVHTSLTFSLARARTHALDGAEEIFTSRDYRLGLAVGKALGSIAAPFIVVRYFGAGTDWAVGGGHGADKSRYQLGAGSAFGLSEHFDAITELAVLGERRATLGMGYIF